MPGTEDYDGAPDNGSVWKQGGDDSRRVVARRFLERTILTAPPLGEPATGTSTQTSATTMSGFVWPGRFNLLFPLRA